MFKRILSTILVAALSVILFTGCASSKPEKFDAVLFINECRIAVLPSMYPDTNTKEFKLDFAKNVLETFGRSDYYKNMNEEQRFEAIEQLGDVLETYSYGPAEDGFVWDFTINKKEHSVSWTVKYYNDTKVMWMMPGY